MKIFIRNNNKRKNYRLIILFAIILYIFCGNMLAVYTIALPYRDWLLLLITFVGLISLILYVFQHSLKKSSPILILFLFVMFSIIPTILRYSGGRFTTIAYETSEAFFWIAIFALAYLIGVRDEFAFEKVKWVAILFVPIFTYLFIHIKIFSANRGIALISSVYYIVMLMPILFLIKNSVIKYTLLFLVFSGVLLSVKRTAFLAFGLTICIYYLVDYKVKANNSKKRLYMIIGGFILTVLLYFFLNYFIEKFDIQIISRLSSMFEDEGSGRVDIWQTTWEMIKQSDIMSLIFGHGYNSVYLDSGIQYSAHTDFLEVIYDYGIIGTMLYLKFYMVLFRYFRFLYLKKSELAAPMACSLVLAFIVSATSHLLIYPTYFILLCVFWGILSGNLEKQYFRIKGSKK